MSVDPWNLELARVGKQMVFDVPAFVFLYAIVAVAAWRKPRLQLAGVGIVVVALVVFSSRALPPIAASPLLTRADALGRASRESRCASKKEVVVILGGGAYTPEVPSVATHMRVVEGAKVVKQAGQEKRKLKVVLTGGADPDVPGLTEAQVMKRTLFLELGESGREHEFLLEAQSANTYQNAARTRELLRARKIPLDVVLVTGALHMPRAARTFEKAGFKVCPVPAPAANLRSTGLSSFRAGALTVEVLNEYVGILGYKWKGWY